jgi:hypothetical protein
VPTAKTKENPAGVNRRISWFTALRSVRTE